MRRDGPSYFVFNITHYRKIYHHLTQVIRNAYRFVLFSTADAVLFGLRRVVALWLGAWYSDIITGDKYKDAAMPGVRLPGVQTEEW